MSDRYEDASGTEIKIGTRVSADSNLPGGTVVRLDEMDGDYDDDLQRAVQYGPYVHVEWDDFPGDPERFSGYLVNVGYPGYEDEPFVFMFDDIEVVADNWEPDDEIVESDDDTIEEGFSYGEDLV